MSKQSQEIQDHVMTVNMEARNLSETKLRGRLYGYIKNHKKTVKNGQARARESEEYKAEAKESKPKPGKVKPSENTKILKENQALRKTVLTRLGLCQISTEDINVSKLNVERPWLSEAEGFNLLNYDTGRILSIKSHVSVIESSVTMIVMDSSVTDYDSAKESTSVYSTPLSPLEKLPGAEPQNELQPGPKTIKSILKACSTRKDETSKDVIINEIINSSAPAKGTKNVSASKKNSASFGKLKNVITERTDRITCDHAEYIRSINMVQHLKTQGESSSRSQSFIPLKPFLPWKHYGYNDHKSDDYINYLICEICGNHTTSDHNDIEWFRKGEALQAKKVESLNANRSKTPTKSYLHKYVEQPGLKVVFGDVSTCTTEGYGSIKCNGIVFTKVAFVNSLKYNLVSCMTRSSTKELFTPFKNPKQEFRSSRKLFKTLSLDESSSPEFDLFTDLGEHSEEEVAETMAKTMEEYMCKTRGDYGSGVTRPKIDDKDHFELKGQFLKELRDNTFSGSDHEDASEHIEKVLKIVDLFHILNIP
ncbi:hypothetical protein Tco_0473081 [Tanacetum coccineum]